MSRGKVLVVDDEPDIIRSVSMRLKASGYDVISATDGMQATSMAIKERPDLVILDIGLPAGDGHTVAHQLLRHEETRFTPIIFLSASHAERDHWLAYDCGISKYITKPFESSDLLAAVEELRSSGEERFGCCKSRPRKPTMEV